MRVGKWSKTPVVPRRSHGGFTLLFVLFTLAVISLGLANFGQVYSDQVVRDREQELLRIGGLYVKALRAYHAESPGNQGTYPMKLDDLLRDGRYVDLVRHLRKLYPDPLQPDQPWGVVRDANGAIVGVYSTSSKRPLAQGSFTAPLKQAARYSDWKFLAQSLP